MATAPVKWVAPPDELKDYPTGDGQPVGETPLHRDNLLYTVFMLRRHFLEDEMTYVSGNMFLYYVEGDKNRHVSPDVFVVRGISNGYRDAYFTWEEGGKGPDVVIEMTSPSTRDEDLKKKFTLYRDVLKVREYFLFDPVAEYLDPQLQGYRLIEGQYVRIEPIAGDRLVSEVLGLQFETLGPHSLLRVYDPAGRRWLRDPEDINHFMEHEQARANALEVEAQFLEGERTRERIERERLEAERERLEAERERERIERERLEAERERERIERERLEAERERLEADRERLEQELARSEAERQKLLAELESLRRQSQSGTPER